MSHISVFGLGAMGSALVTALLRAGRDVTVWNRTAERAEACASQGARRADTVAEALDASPVAVFCVLDDPAVREILEQVPEKLVGKHLINLTNGTPAQSVELSDWVVARGARLLDGAILVTPEMIGHAEASILYSGDRGVFETTGSLLTCWAEPVYLGEEIRLAAVHDLAFLSAMFGMFSGYLHAAALLRSQGTPMTAVTPRIARLLEAMIGTLPETAAQIDSGHYPPPTSNNRMMTSGLANIVAGSAQQGVRPDLMRPVLELFERGVEAGLGELDISALVPLLYGVTQPSTN